MKVSIRSTGVFGANHRQLEGWKSLMEPDSENPRFPQMTISQKDDVAKVQESDLFCWVEFVSHI